jgi:hypothetical protein
MACNFLHVLPKKVAASERRSTKGLSAGLLLTLILTRLVTFDRMIACDKHTVRSFPNRSQQRRQLCVGSSTVRHWLIKEGDTGFYQTSAYSICKAPATTGICTIASQSFPINLTVNGIVGAVLCH